MNRQMIKYQLVKKTDKLLRKVNLGLCGWCSIPVYNKTRCDKCQLELEDMRREEYANDAYQDAVNEARMCYEDLD